MLAQVVDVDEPALEEDNGEVPVVSIRGWGAIQYMFKTEREASAFQDELGIFIQDAINEKLGRLKN